MSDTLTPPTHIQTHYPFRCSYSTCKRKVYLSILTPLDERPTCPLHNTLYIPHIIYSTAPTLRHIEEQEITPALAHEYLSRTIPSSFDNVNKSLVRYYAHLMRTGKWIDVDIPMGGEHYPIYFRDMRLSLGIQRLQACIQASTTFRTVAVYTFSEY